MCCHVTEERSHEVLEELMAYENLRDRLDMAVLQRYLLYVYSKRWRSDEWNQVKKEQNESATQIYVLDFSEYCR